MNPTRLALEVVMLIAAVVSWPAAVDAAEVRPLPNGLLATVDDGSTVRVEVWADRIVRVRHTVSGLLVDHPSFAVVTAPRPVKWERADMDASAGLRTSAIAVHVDRATGAVTFDDVRTSRPFLAETPGTRGVTTRVVDRTTVHGVRQSFSLSDGESIYGLGQHQDGVMDYVGHRVHLQQKNTEIAVPVLTSSAGYALLWDNPSVTDVDVAATDRGAVQWSSEAGDAIDYYVCYGPDLDGAIGGYRQLTGDAPMFGRWVWGFWQSRERYENQKQIEGVAAEYRHRGIPIDGIVQDWQYWGNHPWGSHDFAAETFPDPAGLVRTLHDEHLHTIISVWAKFDKGSGNHDELARAGLLYPTIYRNVFPPGLAQWYDAFDPAARAMYWRQISDEIGRYGWDGYWLDATEPELGGNWGEMRSLTTAAGPGYAVFNAYPLQTTSAVYAGQRKNRPNQRALILTRSAYAGQQRNGSICWSGDIAGTWDVFKRQIPAGLNFSASGLPYWNTDTGGFFGGDHNDPAYRELFTRWFQFSSLCPMFRVHGTGSHKEQWEFGAETARILLDYDRLRYRLLPYTYSQSWDVTSRDGTMMRPLVFDFPNDPAVRRIPDQYMFGPALMACPVTDPVGGASAVIPSTSLVDRDGKPGGLSATYYQGRNFETKVVERVDRAIDFDWDKVKREGVGANPRTDPIPGLNMDQFSVRWEGSVRTTRAGRYRFQLKADDGMRLWVDGKLVIEDWNARVAVTKEATVELPADAKVPIKVEYFQDIYAALIELRWEPPADSTSGGFTRSVYLPAGNWRDFWTGEAVNGGRSIAAAAPIERMPLYVREGSIVPMGPVVEYAGQQPDAPLELRVYRGSNGSFTLYDDAGDGYGYEHGERSTIPLSWDEAAGTLTIGPRAGAYPGMAERRQFKVVFVDAGQGAGPDETKDPDQIVDFNGMAAVVHRQPRAVTKPQR